MTNGVFSEYELREMGIKVAGSTDYQTASCVGSCEEEMNVKVVSKSCRGVVIKKTVKGDGTGKLALSMHFPLEIFNEVYGMNLETLVDGVKAYGQHSIHKNFAITQHVYDEDGEEKFKAYPNCIIETGVVRKIENGAEEVAEVELEVNVMPDEYGNGMYEALASELKDETLKTNWMTKFEPSMVQVESA